MTKRIPVKTGSVAPAPGHQRYIWAAYATFWTMLGLLQALGPASSEGGERPAREWIARNFLDVYSWGLLALAALWLAHRYPIRRERLARDVFLHVSAGIAIIAVRLFATNAIADSLGIGRMVPLSFFMRVLPYNLPMYAAMLGAGHAVIYMRELRQRDITAAKLRAELSAAQHQVLRMQMQPHFLFNTLNSVVSLIHHDPNAAERVVVNLSEMLRRSLAPADAPEITLAEELDFLAPYLDIERTRLRGRLEVQTHIDPAVLQAWLPQLTLQPLVENAVRHGIAPRRGAGKITIAARRVDEILELTVRDDGIGSESYSRNGSVGLPSLETRLHQLYGDRAYFRVSREPAGGTVVEVGIPFTLEEGESAGFAG